MEETKVKDGGQVQVRVPSQSPPHLYNNTGVVGSSFMQIQQQIQIQPQPMPYQNQGLIQGQGQNLNHGHNFGPPQQTQSQPQPYKQPGPPPMPNMTMNMNMNMNNMNSGPGLTSWPPPPPSPSQPPSLSRSPSMNMNYTPPTPSPSPSMNYTSSSAQSPNYVHHGPPTPNQNSGVVPNYGAPPSTPSPNYLHHGPSTPNQNQQQGMTTGNYGPSTPSPNYVHHGPSTPNQNYGQSPSTPSPNYLHHGPPTPNQNQNSSVSLSTNYGGGPPSVSSNYGPGPLTPNQNQNQMQSQMQNPPVSVSTSASSAMTMNSLLGGSGPPPTPAPPPTTSSSGELQNELLKQLLQNTGCASMSQVLSETPGFSLLNTCLTTKPPLSSSTMSTTAIPPATATTTPLRQSHLSEAATRIPQPTPRPFENSMQQQQQQMQQQQQPQLQQQQELPSQMHQQQQQQPPPSPMSMSMSTPSPAPYRHPPQVYDWGSNVNANVNVNVNARPQPQPSPLTSPRLSSDGSPLIGPPPPPPPDRDVSTTAATAKPMTPKNDQSELFSTTGNNSNTNSNSVSVMTPTPGVTGTVTAGPTAAVDGIDHKPMLDMTMFSSLPPSGPTGPKKMDDEAKKAKRRQYQAKRRQSQIKEQQLQQQLLLQQQQQQQTPPLTPTTTTPTTGTGTTATTPTATPSTSKKRARKASKIEENYDGFIENLMTQLRRLPPVGVVEPEIEKNYSICECYGQSDLSNLKFKTSETTGTGGHNKGPPMYIGVGDLDGELGCSTLTHRLDYYNSQQSPGEDHPVRLPQQQIQRGFYYQEFACPRIVGAGDKVGAGMNRTPTPVRDTDTPDTIVSCSSPECGQDTKKSVNNRYPGLKFIDPADDPEETAKYTRESPDITIVSPIPIRPNMLTTNHDKENQNIVPRPTGVNRLGFGSGLRNHGNVSVTLTLSSTASDDIGVVLRDLANILALASQGGTPGSGSVVAASAAAAALQQKSNDASFIYKSKDGKEFDDIQSILNGATKFCRHCDVIILSNMIKKSAADFPGIGLADTSSLIPGDSLDSPNEFYFCSSACLLQFSISQGLSEIEDKPGAIVSHPSGSGSSSESKRKRTPSATSSDLLGDSAAPENLEDGDGPPKKKWKGLRYKKWSPNIKPEQKYKKPSEKEMTEMLFRLGITVLPKHLQDDCRKCLFCGKTGDGISNGPARLLNVDVDKYVHLNCALWSKEVYETENGGLVNLEGALKSSLVLTCVLCKQKGGTVKCFKNRCSSVYHLGCAVKEGCLFTKTKTVFCPAHASKEEKINELTTLKVNRRVYIQRDENRQVGAVLHHAHADSSCQTYLLRVGSLILLNIGQLLPHQLSAFHSRNYIYPIGFKIVRFYWSMKRLNKRCQYICSIHEVDGRPEFRISPQEEPGVVVGTSKESQSILKSDTARGAWLQVVEPVAKLRSAANGIKVFPKYITGEDLFGLTEPAIVKVLESLPGVETLTDYHFKYGRNPLLELPLAINPTGCARSEPKLRTHFKRPHGTQRTAGLFASASAAGSNAAALSASSYLSDFGLSCPYSKQFVHSKSSQYKKMKQEWRNNIYLARSKIQGLGLYAARDIEKHTMVIEYIGEIIRKKLADRRENRYEGQNRGIYMFRIDDDRVIDATLCGGLARYINHSCNPNCITETVEVDRDLKIIIFANRRISRGEELSYDYKFEFEDAQHKIPCLCGASSCRQWMN